MSDPASPAIARAHQLTHTWGDRPLFGPLDLLIPAGVTLVQGDEQTGKTTLLRILAGEVVPSGGWVETMGLRPDAQAAPYTRQVFRTEPLSEALDQTAPADWFATLPQRYPAFDRAALQALTEGFGLAPHMAKPLYMLSAGSRRKVWLSAAFASSASLTLIDQPFAALDGPSIRLLREVLQEFAEQSTRACVIADYGAPGGIHLASTVAL